MGRVEGDEVVDVGQLVVPTAGVALEKVAGHHAAPLGWSIVTARTPATTPANDTVPAAAARTGVPSGTARSIPLWPGP